MPELGPLSSKPYVNVNGREPIPLLDANHVKKSGTCGQLPLTTRGGGGVGTRPWW